MMLLVVLLLVLILGVCLSPKKVKTTPVSTPEIELYRREHASGIVVTDAVITFPESYGKVIYTDGSDADAELSAMRIKLTYGRQAEFPFNSSQRLSSGGGLTFTEVDDGLNPAIWYKPSEQGKKIMLTFEDSFYLQGQDVILEVGFKNEGMDTYEIAQKNFGKPTGDGDKWSDCTADSQCAEGLLCLKSDINGGGRCLSPGDCAWAANNDGTTPEDRCGYTVVNDMKIDAMPFISSQESLDDCMALCTDNSSCIQFVRTPGGYCQFFDQTAVPNEAAGYTTYKKI